MTSSMSATAPAVPAEGHDHGRDGPRALFVTTDAATLRAFLLPFARHFRERGWQVDALAARMDTTPECHDAFDRVWNARWGRGISGRADAAAVRQVREIVADRRHDLVHVHTPVAAALTRYALRHHPAHGHDVRLVYTAHGFHFRDGGSRTGRLPFRIVEQVAGRWTDHLIVINDADEALARRHHLVPPERLELMPGIGVDTDHFDPARVSPAEVHAVRRSHGIPRHARVLTLIAEFSPRKRHVDALDAVARLRSADVHLLLVGGGTAERKQTVVDRARSLGIHERVHLAGRTSDVRPYILAADAVLQVSDREGLPRSVMEAMSLGVPAIGTDTPGTRDLLRDGRGTLVPVGRPAVLAAAIDRVLSEGPDDRSVAAARAYVRSDLRIERIIERHEATYARLLAVAP